MNTEKPIYERLEDEPNQWYARFLLYRNQGATKRSLLGTVHLYQAQKGPIKPYKCVPGAWKAAFEKYQWKPRAEAYDAKLQAEIEERQAILFQAEQAEIERILSEDYAAIHKRVAGLANMAHLIELSFLDKESGEIDFRFFNPDKVREYRGCLDDIAKELGHRVRKSDLKSVAQPDIATDWGGGALSEE